jgi:hypothetical protein
LIEIEVQNETHQTQERIRFAAVPRIGEGLRLREPDGMWASYDVLDVWYQKAEYGDIWMPYVHVCLTPEDGAETAGAATGVSGEAAFDPPAAAAATASFDDAAHGATQGQANGLEDEDEPFDEDEAHDLSGEDAFAVLGGEARPFKI